MEFKIRGCKIYISLLFLSFIILMLLLDRSGVILTGLLAVMLHELGHLFFMLICKAMPQKISFYPNGIFIKKQAGIISYKKELAIASGGCIINLATALCCAPFALGNADEMQLLLMSSSIMIMLMNLLPIKGLDGYDLMYYSLVGRIPHQKCLKICKTVSAIALAMLFALVCMLMLGRYANVSLAMCVVYLIILTIINMRY